jgi:hypothetical protein
MAPEHGASQGDEPPLGQTDQPASGGGIARAVPFKQVLCLIRLGHGFVSIGRLELKASYAIIILTTNPRAGSPTRAPSVVAPGPALTTGVDSFLGPNKPTVLLSTEALDSRILPGRVDGLGAIEIPPGIQLTNSPREGT